MLPALALLTLTAFAIAALATRLVLHVSTRFNLQDSAPAPGQIKEAHRPIPNTGGIGLFLGIALPMLAALALIWAGPELPGFLAPAQVHLDGARDQTGLALALLATLAALHIMGLIDDRSPLGPWPKLAVMAIPAILFAVFSETRLLTALDIHAGGIWLSVIITVLWMLGVTNSMNMIDNMDGASAGIAVVAGLCFLAAAIIAEQWFVAATLALLIGACAGFLVWNRPPARIFMGDGGSLVIGFLLAFLTVRTTYAGETPAGEPLAGGWYAVFMPVLVLALPLYDTVSVTLIRLKQGKSPMVGDLQHLSHRLVKRGLSKRAAVLVLWGLTAVTGIGGIILGRLEPWQAILVATQTLLILVVVALLEWKSSPPGARPDSLATGRLDTDRSPARATADA